MMNVLRIGMYLAALIQVAAFARALDAPQSGPSARMQMLVDAVKPALPVPAAAEDGTVPERGAEESKWFVVWPSEPGDTAIVVKANPLHPDTQKLVANAEEAIQRAVAIAERKAQAAYDRALDELKRTGKATDLDGISLEDEGAAGQRLDADLELTIKLVDPAGYEVGSSVAPAVTTGPPGVTWQVTMPSNTFQDQRTPDRRDQFAAAETRLFVGPIARPAVNRVDDRPRFAVVVPAASRGLAIVLRGNETLLKHVLAGAEWSRVVPR